MINPMQYACPFCNAQFTPKYYNQKFCCRFHQIAFHQKSYRIQKAKLEKLEKIRKMFLEE